MLLLHEARDQKHLDVEYVLQSLIVDNAFTFTAMSTHVGIFESRSNDT